MALYRPVSTQFWTDSKVVNEYTPDDRYFLLYLLTNPYTNLIGCYELSIKNASFQLGWDMEKTENEMKRMADKFHRIGYDTETKEVCIFQWGKYNWTKSPQLISSLESSYQSVKCERFKWFFKQIFVIKSDTVPIPYGYGGGTVASTNASANTYTYSIHNPIKINKKLKEEAQEESEMSEADIAKAVKVAEYKWVDDENK